MRKVYIFSGYFINGFTDGHKETLQAIKSEMKDDDMLVIIINNVLQQTQKYVNKTRGLMEITKMIEPYLIENFPSYRIEWSCDDDRTVCKTLEKIKIWHSADVYYFCNAGDVKEHCAEEKVEGIDFIYYDLPKITSSGEEKR